MPEGINQLAPEPQPHELSELISAIPLSAALVCQDGGVEAVNLKWMESLVRFGVDQVFVRPQQSWPPAALSSTPLYAYLRESLRGVCAGKLKRFDHCALAQCEGSTHRLNVSLTPLRGDGRRLALLCVNISRQGDWWDNQFESENRQAQIMDTLSEGLVIHDRRGIVLDCNQAAEKILGLTREQMTGRSNADPRLGMIREDGSPSAPEEHPASIAMRTGRSVDNEVRGLTLPNGNIHWLRISSRPIFLPQSDHPDVSATTFVNITQEKQRQRELQELSERLQLALRAGAIGIWDLDLQTGKLIWDDVMHQIYRLDKRGFRGVYEDWSDHVHPDDLEEASRLLQEAIDQQSIFSGEFRIIWPDGRIRHIAAHAVVRTDDAGRSVRFNGMNADITDIRETEKNLRDRSLELENTRERLQNIVENLPVGAVYVEGERVSINARTEEITGYDRALLDSVDNCFAKLLRANNAKTKAIYQKIRRRRTLPKSMKVRIYRNDDQIRWIDFSGCKIDGGEAWILKDITEQRRAEIELKALAYYDLLTKLPNRSATEKRLAEALARAQRETIKVAVLLIDIDHFKNVNDIYGHPSGDRLLVEVANKLRRRVRRSDVLGRIGGDEFMLIVENVDDSDSLERLAKALVDSCADPIALENNIVISAQISVGISVYPDHGGDAVHLFRNADTALYKAKSRGRRTFQMYEPSFTRALENRLTMEQRLERAIEAEEFAVHYQPIVDTQRRKIVGAEALLRWHDPDLGLVSPADFIPVAEESGLVSPIGRWVLTTVCRQMALWQRNHLPLSSVSVNISGMQFAESDLFEQVKQAIDHAQLDPALLTLEITESTLMQNKTSTKDALLKLRGIGVGLAIDDFGTGYSSLAYLKYFAINTLKIDRSFIRDIPGDYDDVQITEAIISMAKKLKLHVVAEGIETEDQLKFIEGRGCNSFQGFIVSPAVPAAEFSKLLERF